VELTAHTGARCSYPPEYAHGFVTLSEDAEVYYMIPSARPSRHADFVGHPPSHPMAADAQRHFTAAMPAYRAGVDAAVSQTKTRAGDGARRIYRSVERRAAAAGYEFTRLSNHAQRRSLESFTALRACADC